MDKKSWFATLIVFNLALLSLSTLLLVRFGNANATLVAFAPVMLSALSVFLYAHLLDKSTRGEHRRHLSSREVDSVYYAGFLVTLMVLTAAVFEVVVGLGKEGKGLELLTLVAAKFALGLLVTGIGLFMRIRLQSRILDDETPQDLLNEYADKIGIVNDRLQTSAQVVQDNLIQVLDNARNAGKESTKAMVDVISSELSPAATQLKDTITKINRAFARFEQGRFDDLSTAADALTRNLEGLANSVKPLSVEFDAQTSKQSALGVAVNSVSESAANLSKQLDGFVTAAASGVAAVTEFTAAAQKSGSVQGDLERLSQRLQASFAQFEQARFAELSQSTRQLSTDLTSLQESFGHLQRGVTDAAGSFDRVVSGNTQLVAAGELATAQISALSDSARVGVGALGDLNVAVGTTGAMQEELLNLSAAIRQSFGAIVDSSQSLAAQIARGAETFGAIGTGFNTEAIRQFAIEIGRSADATRQFADNLRQPIDELTRLTEGSTGALAAAVRLLNDSSQTMTQSTNALGGAMVNLANAIRDAANTAARQ